MKKLLIVLFLLNLFVLPSYSVELFKKSPKAEIKATLKNLDKAFHNQDIEKIKTFYNDNYKSADGFDLAKTIQMLEKTYEVYENIKYNTKITSISADDEWALVQVQDKTKANIYPIQDKKLKEEKKGTLKSESIYNVYLKKEAGFWKIISEEILMEETSLKYGIANKLDMNLISPLKIKNGQEYDVALKIKKPKDVVALASISSEEIVFPASDYQEKFRKIPEMGELERVVRANNKNLNEYAVASIGLTKVSINEEQTKAKIEVLGMAYLMKRVNMENCKNQENILVEHN